MKEFKIRSVIRSTVLLLGIAALLTGSSILTGCASTPKAAMPSPSQDWSTETGQLQYRPRAGRSVIGDVVVRRSGSQDFLLIFTSGPGVPLLRLQVHGSTAVAEGLFARGRWSGETDKAPPQLRGWLKLPAVFSATETRKTELRTASWSSTIRYAGTRPQRIEVDSPDTGEQFNFHFSP
jgi:hypothetical protein